MSSLCLDPLADGLSCISAKLSAIAISSTSLDNNNNNNSGSKGSDWISFDSTSSSYGRLGNNYNNNNIKSNTTTTSSGLFNWTSSSNTPSPPSSSSLESSKALQSLSWSDPRNVSPSSFFGAGLNNNNNNINGFESNMKDTASMLISQGLSDREEEIITAKALSRSRKSNIELLLNNRGFFVFQIIIIIIISDCCFGVDLADP